jgi:RimJ/RimL family protein N-acetyltransferase
MIAPWRLVTARLVLAPVAYTDLRDLQALKADPRAFGQMLGGVRSAVQTAEELAQDIQLWGAYGFGIWAIRLRAGGAFQGITGLMHRDDGLGIALRFALWPQARGLGLASEAAAAALVFAHETAGLRRVVAVAREDNFASRTVLGAIGMARTGQFFRHGHSLLVYHSVREQTAG